jgi:hypothetical protein
MACGLRGQAGAGRRLVGSLATFDASASTPHGETAAEARNDLPDEAARVGSNRDIGARRRCLNGGVTSDALFQVDDVPMANPRLAGRHSGGAKVLLRCGGV